MKRRRVIIASLACLGLACGGGTTASSDPADGGTPTGDASPSDVGAPNTDAAPRPTILIKHVVVIVKENHTFDNYFGSFPGAEGISKIQTTGGTITPPQAPDRTPRDLCHQHACALTDYAAGKMNGWDQTAGTSQNGDNLAYAQYREADIPNYWQYARHFTLADHFFANVLGPSFPGHTEVLAAQAGWAWGNPNTQLLHPYWGCDQSSGSTVPIQDQATCSEKQVFPCFDIPSVPDVLPKGVDWKFYGSDFYVLGEVWSMFNAIKSVREGQGWSNVVNADTFDSDIDQKKLPAVSWLVDQDLDDEHPNIGSVCAGENWTVGHINKLMASEYWKDTAILFTMDDFGGWYDHVPPPRQYGCDPKNPYGLGFRLPLIVISPYAKQGYVMKDVAEQASIPRFIEEVFGAPTLSSLDPAAQDGQANDLMGAFDFTQKPLPPLTLQPRSCP